jgi:hypothetical protein
LKAESIPPESILVIHGRVGKIGTVVEDIVTTKKKPHMQNAGEIPKVTLETSQ